MTSKTYRVVWEIEIVAETPEAAAKQALHIQRDPYSGATFFDVRSPEGEITQVDCLHCINEGP